MQASRLATRSSRQDQATRDKDGHCPRDGASIPERRVWRSSAPSRAGGRIQRGRGPACRSHALSRAAPVTREPSKCAGRPGPPQVQVPHVLLGTERPSTGPAGWTAWTELPLLHADTGERGSRGASGRTGKRRRPRAALLLKVRGDGGSREERRLEPRCTLLQSDRQALPTAQARAQHAGHGRRSLPCPRRWVPRAAPAALRNAVQSPPVLPSFAPHWNAFPGDEDSRAGTGRSAGAGGSPGGSARGRWAALGLGSFLCGAGSPRQPRLQPVLLPAPRTRQSCCHRSSEPPCGVARACPLSLHCTLQVCARFSTETVVH